MMNRLTFFLKAYFQQPPLGDGYNSELEYSKYVIENNLLFWHQYIISSDHIVYKCFQHPLIGNKIPGKGWVIKKTEDLGSGVFFLDTVGPLLKGSGLLRSKPFAECIPGSGELIQIKYSIESIKANNDWSFVKMFHYFVNGYYTPGSGKNKKFNQLMEVIKFMLYETVTANKH